MDTKAIVAAYTESLRVRETLAVLLERDCHVRFLPPEIGVTAPISAPDLAVLATAAPGPLAAELADRWPRLPIVAIDPRPLGGSASGFEPAWAIETVPLEPEAIRAAVIRRLPAVYPDAAIRHGVGRVGEALSAALQYPLAMLRTVPTLTAHRAGADTDAILAAIVREQVWVINEVVEHMRLFRTRPRVTERSEQFVSALCRLLAASDAAATQRGVLVLGAGGRPAPAVPGPLELAPLVARLVRVHLRRRAAVSVVAVRSGAHGVRMQYALRPGAATQAPSWPLLLADTALAPCSWRVVAAAGDGEETITVRAA